MTTLSVFDAARELPGRLAIVNGELHICFRELAERVRARIEDLTEITDDDESPASLVALQTDERLPALEVLLALIELRRAFLPLHSRLAAPEREQLLDGLPVRWLVTTSDDGALHLERRRHQLLPRHSLLDGAHPLAALATSGTSGTPRVAVLGRRAFMASAAASSANLGWHAGDRWLLCLPLAHVGGLSVVTRCLLARCAIVLTPPRQGTGSLERLISAMTEGRPTLVSLVPTQLHGLLEREPRLELPSSVRALLTGGAAASARLLDACADRGWPVLTSYGLTEACSQVATQRPGSINRGELGVGRPLPGIGVRLDEGVICISGPTLFAGYLGDPRDEDRGPRTELRTRDLGRFDADGNLHLLGRIDDLIITGGENVAPWEVESVLESCAGVLEACVFGVADPKWGQVVAAGLRTNAPTRSIVDAVDQVCQRRLSVFKRPRLYACTDSFLHGPTGKLDRGATAHRLSAALAPP
jgi:o-succinylbenzoate---CoA ligase